MDDCKAGEQKAGENKNQTEMKGKRRESGKPERSCTVSSRARASRGPPGFGAVASLSPARTQQTPIGVIICHSTDSETNTWAARADPLPHARLCPSGRLPLQRPHTHRAPRLSPTPTRSQLGRHRVVLSQPQKDPDSPSLSSEHLQEKYPPML